jgi:hypothetical protein
VRRTGPKGQVGSDGRLHEPITRRLAVCALENATEAVQCMCSLGLLAYSRDVECLAESDGGIMVTLTLNFLTPSNMQVFKLHTVQHESYDGCTRPVSPPESDSAASCTRSASPRLHISRIALSRHGLK